MSTQDSPITAPSMLRGFGAVLRHELTTGWWPAPFVALIVCLLTLVINAESFLVGEPAVYGILLIVVIACAPLSIHRLRPEGEEFLAALPVGRRAVLLAKGTVTGLEAALVATAAGTLLAVWCNRGLSYSDLPAALGFCLVAINVLWCSAITFCLFATVPSVWIAGWLTFSALLLMLVGNKAIVRALNARDVEGAFVTTGETLVLILVGALVPLAIVLALVCGTPWRRATA